MILNVNAAVVSASAATETGIGAQMGVATAVVAEALIGVMPMGADLDSVQLDKQYIGYLPKDSSAVLENYKEFKASGSWPLMKIRAVDDKGNKSHNLTECGTKAKVIKDGRHRIDIKVANPEFGNILTLMLRD